MLKLLLFLKRIHYVLLFIALEAIAISVFLHSNVYHKARIAGATDHLVSGIYGQLTDISSYFGLRSENQRLVQELARLRTRMSAHLHTDSLLSQSDTVPGLQYYQYQPALVVRNSISKRQNYLTVDRGTLDGVEPEMALVSDDGIVGYIIHSSDHYSVAVSILNTQDFRTSGRIQGSDFFGSIYWDGLSHREVILDEMPKYADMNIGDTIVTTNYSYIFPPDQPIGTVQSYEMVNGTFYKVRVRLFADLARTRHVYIVRYLEQEERRTLEQTIGNPEIGNPTDPRIPNAGNAIPEKQEGGRP